MCTGFFTLPPSFCSVWLTCLRYFQEVRQWKKQRKAPRIPAHCCHWCQILRNAGPCIFTLWHQACSYLNFLNFPKAFLNSLPFSFFEVLLKLTSYNISFFQNIFRLNSVKTNKKKFHTCNLRVCVTELVRYLHSVVNTNAKRTALNDGDCPPHLLVCPCRRIFKPTNTSTVNQTGKGAKITKLYQ